MTAAPAAQADVPLLAHLGRARGWKVAEMNSRKTVFLIGCGLRLAIEVCSGGPVVAMLEVRVGDIANLQTAEDLASALGAKLADAALAVARPDMAL